MAASVKCLREKVATTSAQCEVSLAAAVGPARELSSRPEPRASCILTESRASRVVPIFSLHINTYLRIHIGRGMYLASRSSSLLAGISALELYVRGLDFAHTRGY